MHVQIAEQDLLFGTLVCRRQMPCRLRLLGTAGDDHLIGNGCAGDAAGLFMMPAAAGCDNERNEHQ